MRAWSLILLVFACFACGGRAAKSPVVLWEAGNVDYHTASPTGDAIAFVDMSDRHVVALDARTGAQRWEWAGKEIFPSSLTAAEGAVFVSQRSGRLTALDVKTGAVRWRTDLHCTLQYPIASDGLLVSTCTDFDARPLRGAAVAVDMRSGAKRWEVPFPDSVSFRPGLDADAAYFATSIKRGSLVLSIERASGKERWRVTIPQTAYTVRPVGDVLVTQGIGMSGLRRSDGAVLWHQAYDDGWWMGEDRAISIYRDLVIAPRGTAIDGLDPATGLVKHTWPMPALVADDDFELEDVRVSAGVMTAHFSRGVWPGTLVVWDGSSRHTYQIPSGHLSAIHGKLIMLGEMGVLSAGVQAIALPGSGISPPGKARKTRPDAPLFSGESDAGPCAEQELEISGDQLTVLVHGIVRSTPAVHGPELFFMGGDSLQIVNRNTGAVENRPLSGEISRRFAVDDGFFYWSRCGSGGCGRHGDNQVIVRAPRSGGEPTILAEGLGLVSALSVDSTDVYWGEWHDDYGARGSVGVVSKAGGDKRVLWSGGAVSQLTENGDSLFWISHRELVSLPKAGGVATVLLQGLQEGKAFVVDDDAIFAVDEGELYWASPDSGHLWRVPRGGGEAVDLLGPIRWPQHVAADATHAYVLLREGELISVPRGGGERVTLAGKQGENSCSKSSWLWSDGHGVFWIWGTWIEATKTMDWQLLRIGPAR